MDRCSSPGVIGLWGGGIRFFIFGFHRHYELVAHHFRHHTVRFFFVSSVMNCLTLITGVSAIRVI